MLTSPGHYLPTPKTWLPPRVLATSSPTWPPPHTLFGVTTLPPPMPSLDPRIELTSAVPNKGGGPHANASDRGCEPHANVADGGGRPHASAAIGDGDGGARGSRPTERGMACVAVGERNERAALLLKIF